MQSMNQRYILLFAVLSIPSWNSWYKTQPKVTQPEPVKKPVQKSYETLRAYLESQLNEEVIEVEKPFYYRCIKDLVNIFGKKEKPKPKQSLLTLVFKVFVLKLSQFIKSFDSNGNLDSELIEIAVKLFILQIAALV